MGGEVGEFVVAPGGAPDKGGVDVCGEVLVVGCADGDLGVVQQHPRSAVPAVEQAFEVMGVPRVPSRMSVTGLEEGLDLVEQGRFDEGLVGSGVECALVADDPGVVGLVSSL